jgi:2-dehydro-3-deoxyglucarate aldolase/4-hydroxy-2-oxoheptanedioate aldolase
VPLQPPPAGSLRARILAGETLFGSFVSGGSAIHAELLARAGFDWLIVDLEHGAGTESELMGQLHAIGDRTTAIVRPQSGERLRIGRALDLGAAGIMVPRLETVDEVRETLPYLRYPPEGVRGLALATRGAQLGEVAHADIAGLNASVVGVFRSSRRSRSGTPPRSRPSTASTSSLSARPTCRMRWASRADSRSRRSSRRCGP